MQKTCLLKIIPVLGAFLILLSGTVHAQDETKNPGAENTQNASAKVALMTKRIRELETQIVDMQVAIGALESLVKQQRTQESNTFNTQTSIQNGQSEQVSGVSSGDNGRIDILETQMRALSSQIEQLTLQMRNGGPQKQTDLGVSKQGNRAANQFGFGGQNIQRDNIKRNDIASLPKTGQETLGSDQSNPVLLYDKAKGLLWRRDFAAAEVAFKDFLKKHGQDNLAGDAQFWLGVTYFERENYRKAAENFLKVYKKYRNGKRAPDSLLRLALSLHKLGERQAACKTFVQLRQKYPNASEAIQNETTSQMKTLRCKS